MPFFLSRVWPDGHLDGVWQIQTGMFRAGLLMNTEGMPVTNTGLREVIVLHFLASEAVWVPVGCLSMWTALSSVQPVSWGPECNPDFV